ncbi:MAG: hypothetical protein ACI83P_000450 [Janthinobacterium sp.]|jgi:hypothetical protein
MFDFLFKRSARKQSKAQPRIPEQAVAVSIAASVRRAEQVALAHALAGDEAGALACVLQSEFADVRLAAAQHIHGQAMLEQLQQAMRNTDRRVAKLMQARLDVIRHEQAEQQKALAAIEAAERLLAHADFSPNQAAELDRRWQVIQAPAPLCEQFSVLRGALAQRLEAQVTLQRAVIDAVAGLRMLPSTGLEHEQAVASLALFASEHAAHSIAVESASLPRQLLREFASVYQQCEAALAQGAREVAQHQAAFEARQSALTAWEETEVAALHPEQIQRRWQNLPALPEGAAASLLQQQFDLIMAAIPAAPQPKQRIADAPRKQAGLDFDSALDAMEAALQQGLLQVASEHDKVLLDSKGSRLSAAQSERLTRVRAEFKRLADWARWGGNISREELVKAAEELPVQTVPLPMGELAKKVGSLRECWKSLDSLSGAAPKALWLRFDAACGAAYAPVALHFKALADERHANAAKAQALIVATTTAGENGSDDWKNLIAEGLRLRQAWTRLGTIDRKEKKRLDAEFGQALDALLAPLEQQRSIEIARREQLIEEVGLLQPGQRNTTATLRVLQEKWQEYAKALPLERRAEQALWQRFRTACDQVFAQRKEQADVADNVRRAHLQDKEAVCATLEVAGGTSLEQASVAATLLRDAEQAWNASGAVPHASEQKIALRYLAAVAQVQAQLDAIALRALAAQASALQQKLRLCQSIESALCSADVDLHGAPWAARWSALPLLSNQYEKVLLARFSGATQALAQPSGVSDGAYALQLEHNRSALLEEVLRLEIAAGIDSGTEFARERLKMQIDTLQSSLKSGQNVRPASASAKFLQLCALPALADMRTVSRIEQLLRHAGALETA